MEIFNQAIDQLKQFAHSKDHLTWMVKHHPMWPAGGNRNIVIGDDVGLELGSPQKASVASLIWTNDPNKIAADTITLIGPDIGKSDNNSLPFGKVVLLETDGFSEDNTYHRYMEMEGVRYDLDLKGYMIRAVSRMQKEWCRISKEALNQGFCFNTLGSALIKKLKKKAYVKKAQLFFITSSVEDVKSVQAIVDPTIRVISAMNKMINEMALDCDSCDYTDVCSDVDVLRGMREKLHDTTQESA